MLYSHAEARLHKVESTPLGLLICPNIPCRHKHMRPWTWESFEGQMCAWKYVVHVHIYVLCSLDISKLALFQNYLNIGQLSSLRQDLFDNEGSNNKHSASDIIIKYLLLCQNCLKVWQLCSLIQDLFDNEGAPL